MISTRAVLIGVDIATAPLPITTSLDELEALAKTAGIQTITRVTQRRDMPHPASYLGSGKLDELALLLTHIIDTTTDTIIIIADDELRPRQLTQLQKRLNCKILDRTSLILDIFATRAQTHEAKIQVELAQLTYLSTRLTRLWTHLSRLGGGGVGTRGPGEKQLEVDKRLNRARIKQLKSHLQAVRKNREIHRLGRAKRPYLVGCLIGYTNAGKSTLFNALTNSDTLVADQLFATLDPTTRKVSLGDAPPLLLTDTVGFIQKLPTLLIDAFQATIESIYDADFFIHVIDSAAPLATQAVHIQTTEAVLHQQNHPVFYVFNKADSATSTADLAEQYTPSQCVSAYNPDDIARLKPKLQDFVRQFERVIQVSVPYTHDYIRHQLHQHGHVLAEDAGPEASQLTVRIEPIIGAKIMAGLPTNTI